MKQLILIPRACGITAKDKEKLSKNGYCAIEMDKVDWVRMISPDGAEVSGSRLLLMALDAINKAPLNSRDSIRETFTKMFAEAIRKDTTDAKGVEQ